LERWRIPSSSDTCELLTRASRTYVRFSGHARSVAVAFLSEVGIDREAGLLLFGSSTDRFIEILRVDHPTLGNEERLHFDFDQVDEDDLVGELHSHPNNRLDPSPVDLAGWASVRRSRGLSAYAAIVGVPLAERWEFAAWVVRLKNASHDVAERALV
jgi:hypothetical protein